MKILVTGWNGHNRSFIPNAVSNHLRAKGHEVDGWEFDNDYEDRFYGWVWSNHFRRYMHAFETKHDWVQRPITYYDLVIHLGAISDTSETDVELILKQNFDFTLWLLNQCQKHGIPLHYASSASVYGNNKQFDEDSKADPKTPYAWSKYMFDRIVQKYHHLWKTPVVGFRYFNVYGETEFHKLDQASPVHKFQKDASDKGYFEIYEGSENFKRDFVWVNDVCQVHEKMVEKYKEVSGIFNVGVGEAVSFKQIADLVAEKAGVEYNIIPMPEKMKSSYQSYTKAKNSKLLSVIDHKFTTVQEYFDKYL